MNSGDLHSSKLSISKFRENRSGIKRFAMIGFGSGLVGSGSGFVIGDSVFFLPEQAVHEGQVELDAIVLTVHQSGLDKLVNDLKKF
jgi:hypothetical protein